MVFIDLGDDALLENCLPGRMSWEYDRPPHQPYVCRQCYLVYFIAQEMIHIKRNKRNIRKTILILTISFIRINDKYDKFKLIISKNRKVILREFLINTMRDPILPAMPCSWIHGKLLSYAILTSSNDSLNLYLMFISTISDINFYAVLTVKKIMLLFQPVNFSTPRPRSVVWNRYTQKTYECFPPMGTWHDICMPPEGSIVDAFCTEIDHDHSPPYVTSSNIYRPNGKVLISPGRVW